MDDWLRTVRLLSSLRRRGTGSAVNSMFSVQYSMLQTCVNSMNGLQVTYTGFSTPKPLGSAMMCTR